jgi:hypothetical protein
MFPSRMAQAGGHVVGGRGSSEIQVQLFLGTLQVTQIPDACTGPITYKAGKLPFRFTYIFYTALMMFRPS